MSDYGASGGTALGYSFVFTSAFPPDWQLVAIDMRRLIATWVAIAGLAAAVFILWPEREWPWRSR